MYRGLNAVRAFAPARVALLVAAMLALLMLAGCAAADPGGPFFLGFFVELFSFLKVCLIGGFTLAFVFMVLVALPRSPLRNACMQALLWGVALVAGFLVVSPADFIPLPLFPDDLLYGGAGLLAAGSALVQKIRQRREERELAMWTRFQAGASYPVPQKTLLVTSNKERTPDEDATE